ncbi:hypothetical protein GDO78_020078 [Eleutherodactylus coqui]|uniref:Uncharacterized protein n=1 Tax=Eleutherodactylus coqui TaxID=57060 RepID=A0A8J6E5Y7_ELECQ|nr:hypothetical protein GDO78_020078 [Eleutherodactylus coqui]
MSLGTLQTSNPRAVMFSSVSQSPLLESSLGWSTLYHTVHLQGGHVGFSREVGISVLV